MTKAQAEARANFTAILADEAEGERTETNGMEVHQRRMAAKAAADLLMRHGKTYARIQEMMCNGVGTWYGESNESFSKRQSRHEAYTEKRDKQLEARITAICAELGPGFVPVFNGDPRGCTVKIQVPSGKTDDWGKEGICVPTA